MATDKKKTRCGATAPPVPRQVCAWCRQAKDGWGPVLEGELVAHGVCKACAHKYFGEPL